MNASLEKRTTMLYAPAGTPVTVIVPLLFCATVGTWLASASTRVWSP